MLLQQGPILALKRPFAMMLNPGKAFFGAEDDVVQKVCVRVGH
jgi:hypothetical protein